MRFPTHRFHGKLLLRRVASQNSTSIVALQQHGHFQMAFLSSQSSPCHRHDGTATKQSTSATSGFKKPSHMYSNSVLGSSNKQPWMLAAAAAAAAMGFLLKPQTTRAEAEKNPPPQKRWTADPIDWDNVWLDTKDKLSADEEQQQQEQEEEEYDIPSYLASHLRKDVGNALNHKAALGTEARNILKTETQYPLQIAELTSAPNVPPPCKRNYPVHLVVDVATVNAQMRVKGSKIYEFWPFAFLDRKDGKVKYGVPGPFIRARVGDTLQVNHTNKDESGMAHSIDFHSVCGPGGGSPTTYAEQDETRTGAFRLMKPGLYVYHCAAAPIPLHIHNGMFGLILVEPEDGLPPVDREFYVMQHEMYLQLEDLKPNARTYEHDYDAATREIPSHVLFNGRENSLVDKPLVVNQDETIRIYFGNAGPNLVSSFHIIGTVFDRVYREGELISHPARCVQTTLVPSGGAAVVELKMQVPGNFAIVDHSINRIDKGAVGFVKVKGKPRPDIYDSSEPPILCPGCKVHN